MGDINKSINKLIEKNGEMRSEFLFNCFLFVEKKEGEEGLSQLKETFDQLEYSFNFKKLSKEDWIKSSLKTAIILLSVDLFDWSNDDLIEMGKFCLKYSTYNKLFLRNVESMDSLLEKIDDFWSINYKTGKLEIEESRKNKIVLNLSDYGVHPADYVFISGFLEAAFSLCTQKDLSIKVKKNNDMNQFSITWK